jgi:hypothetical protein
MEFRDRVLAAAIADRIRKGRAHFADVPPEGLAPIEHGKVMRTEAAVQCIKLLADARKALALDQMGPPADVEAIRRQDLARSVRSIGVASAYRTNAQERHIWTDICFPKYYKATQTRRAAAVGGPHGDEAVHIMVAYFSSRKAPPGFSNHSNGNAVDFTTTQGSEIYTANTSQRAGWRRTWLHPWLTQNAGRYRFHCLDSEEWHWDFR